MTLDRGGGGSSASFVVPFQSVGGVLGAGLTTVSVTLLQYLRNNYVTAQQRVSSRHLGSGSIQYKETAYPFDSLFTERLQGTCPGYGSWKIRGRWGRSDTPHFCHVRHHSPHTE